HQGGVMQPVIPAFKLDDLVAAGSSTCQTYPMHSSFSTAVAEAAHLDRETIANFFCEFPFHVVRHPEHGAGGQTFLHGVHHRGMAMPRHDRAKTKVMVDVVVAVKIAKMRA